VAGVAAVPRATLSATLGIAVATTMRVLLFLAALGVTQQHGTLDTQNPAASVFTLALGGLGTRLFGVVMWAAAITSVIGSAYTSVSFLRFGFPTRDSSASSSSKSNSLASSMNAFMERNQSIVVVVFIIIATAIFLIIGKPVQTLVMAGLVNAFVIPFALGIMLLAARKTELVGNYRHPVWLTVSGGAVAALLLGMSVYALLA
jgi:Mn2+/Fe2+ NRAMP family transporter